jgi:hypothetical protein
MLRPPLLVALIAVGFSVATYTEAAAIPSPEPPALLAPADGATLTMSVPAFRWQRLLNPTPAAMTSYDIQIATDAAFTRVVDHDRLAAVISWYVPDRDLPPQTYWWRVASVDTAGRPGSWSEARTFTVQPAARVVTISRDADFSAVQRAFAAAAAQAPAVVRFEPGEYRLDPGSARHFLRWEEVADVTVDGAGASIVLARPVGWFDLRNCRRVLVKDLILDFAPPAYTAGRIMAVDAAAGTFEADILPGHALPDEVPAYARDKKGMVVTEADEFAMKRGIPLVITHRGFERPAERRFRFTLEDQRHAAHLAPGDVYVLDPRWLLEGGGHGSFVGGGEDVVYLRVTIRSAANECLGSFYSDRHALLHVRLERPPGRALSVNNGGHNHHNARTGPWVEGCLFENTGDDVCHINGYLMSVLRQPALDRLVFSCNQPYDQYGQQAHLDLRPGDRLAFYQRSAGRLLAEAKVVSASAAESTVEVRLDRPVAGVVVGPVRRAAGKGYAEVAPGSAVTEVYNLDRMCNQFVFRHNVARNARRTGVLAKGDGGLIEDNRFENLGGGGVEFWPAPFEGLAAQNYVIRRNAIINCGRLSRQHAGIWITMFRSGGDRLQRNLLIADNRIEGFAGPAMLLCDMQDAVVRDNRIALPAPLTHPGVKPDAIVLRNTSGVIQENNVVVATAP